MFRYIFIFALFLHISLCQESSLSEVGDPTDNLTSTSDPTSTVEPTTEAPTTEPQTTEAPTPEPTTTETEPTTTPTPEPTTTEPAPTTTPAPKWKPGNWTVHDNTNNVTCILAVMALEFKIPYQKADGKNATAVLMVPPTAVAEGTCPDDDQTMSLAFPAGDHTDSVTFNFTSSGSASKNFIISSIELNFYMDNVTFPNAASPTSRTLKDSDVDLFLTQFGKSYKCKSKIEVPVTMTELQAQGDQKINVTLVMEETQIEAFRTVSDAKFGVPMLCSADEFTSDIVPIAVGCALAALVVIVIIAYLIGRRRARAKGYQSM